MNLFSNADGPDDLKRKRLLSMGWRKIEIRGRPLQWETTDGKVFTEEEAFAILDRLDRGGAKR